MTKIIKLIKDNSDIKELTEVFNLSFSDYVCPLQTTEESLKQKIQGDDISMQYSIGVFNEKKLEGFILHAPDNHEKPNQLYNSATGVIPTARGGTVQRCYNEMIPYYKEIGIKSIILEVVTINLGASKVYENCGFKLLRVLNTYKGEINRDLLASFNLDSSIRIKKVDDLNQDLLNFIKNPYSLEIDGAARSVKNSNSSEPLMTPSWSNSVFAIKREFDLGFNKIWIATTFDIEQNKEITVGFVSVNSSSFRIRQVFVLPKYRNKNIATTLFHTMASEFDQKSNYNFSIESTFVNFTSFFTKRIGFTYFLSVNEMLRTL